MADLVNEDSRRYDIVMEEGSSVRNTWIDGGTRMHSEAKSGMTIQIVGGPSIKVGGGGDVVIKDGSISQR